MTERVKRFPTGRRLKGLDEFETPEFVGRMERVRRRRALTWWSLLVTASLIGAALGWLLL